MIRVPWLYYSHPGYFYIALSIALAHLVLGIDGLQEDRHSARIYTYVYPSIELYGYAHFLVAVILLICFFLPTKFWVLARWSFFLSLVTFNMFAVGMIFAVVQLNTSWIAPTRLITLSVSSAAAWREPIIGPLYRHRPDNRRSDKKY